MGNMCRQDDFSKMKVEAERCVSKEEEEEEDVIWWFFQSSVRNLALGTHVPLGTQPDITVALMVLALSARNTLST